MLQSVKGNLTAFGASAGRAVRRLPALLLSLMSQAFTEVLRAKCQFCVGLTSVMLLVIVSAVIQTMLSNSPLLFLKEAESAGGQMDLLLTPNTEHGNTLNYTLISDLVAATSGAKEFSFSTARWQRRCGALRLPSDKAGYIPSQDNSWMYADSGVAWEASAAATLILIDTDREGRMGLGRQWDYDTIPAGSVLLNSETADDLGVGVGDVVVLDVYMPQTVMYAFGPAGFPDHVDPTFRNQWIELTADHPVAYLPFTVHDVVSSTANKFEKDVEQVALVEYGSFVEYVGRHLHPDIRSTSLSTPRASTHRSLYDYASHVVFNIDPDTRMNSYKDSNYDNVQASLVKWGSKVTYLIGFPSVEADLPLVNTLRLNRFASLFLGMLLSILLVILFALSSILIYSLLMINVQSRTFELAVRRTLGTSRAVLATLLVLQALSYALPAWVLGLLISRGITNVLLGSFKSTSGIPVSPELSPDAVLVATVLAFAVPLVGSIAPIRLALYTSLRDALDVSRPKTVATKYSIERADDSAVSWTVMVVGLALTVFGFCIYYLLPLALLTLNLALFVNIFFWILLGLLFGMVLLAINIEIPVETGLAWLLLWWERRVVRKLALTNLVGHRLRNRTTLIMYALSISFIVFITVAATQEIQGAVMEQQRLTGAPLVVYGPSYPSFETVKGVEAALEDPDVAPWVDSYAWVTRAYGSAVPGDAYTELGSLGRLWVRGTPVYGAAPGVFDSMYGRFVNYASRGRSALPLAEQLYTVKGSQGVVASNNMQDLLNVDRGDSFLFLSKEDPPGGGGGGTQMKNNTRMEVHTLMNKASWFEFSKYPTDEQQDAIVSIPSILRLARLRNKNVGVQDLSFGVLLIALSSESRAVKDAVAAKLQGAFYDGGWYVDDGTGDSDNIDTIVTVLNFFFSTLTGVAMFLCFSSLLSSMVANISEQKKEIGVLRAIGMPPGALVRVYVYEAFLLVIAASVMGVLIGTSVAWLFGQQRAMFTGLPFVFVIPYAILITVFLVSALCALLSSCGPARRYTSQPITKLLRSVF